jgi:hypothetical protein
LQTAEDGAACVPSDAKASQASLALLCSLPAPELRERRAEIQAFLEQATRVARLADGVEVEFTASNEVAHALTDFILFERVCCSSITYELRSQPERSGLILRLTGPAEQIDSLRAIFLPGARAGVRYGTDQ